MIRLNDLPRHIRLDLIEETRWQFGAEFTAICMEHNVFIAEMCRWDKTRQGFDYWSWIDKGLFLQLN